MEVWADPDGGLVRLAGTLDVRSVARTREVLHRALHGGSGDLVLDLCGLDAWDAAGLGVVVGAHRAARRLGRRLVLRGAGSGVLRTLAVTRLNRVLHVERLLPA